MVRNVKISRFERNFAPKAAVVICVGALCCWIYMPSMIAFRLIITIVTKIFAVLSKQNSKFNRRKSAHAIVNLRRFALAIIGMATAPTIITMIFRYKPVGSHDKSQSDDDAADSLGEIAGQYQQLLGGSRDDQPMAPALLTAKKKNLVWTRVLSMEGFSIAGCS